MRPTRSIRMRVFVALQLPDKTRQNLSRSAETLRHFDKGGKFVPAANYHITLSFLGEVADDDLIYVQAAMDKVAHMTAPTMAVSQISVLRASDIVCAKFRYDKALTELHEALAEELESRRFTVEHRAYRPHVTLVRKYKFTLPFSEVSKSVDVFNMPFVADKMVLYASNLEGDTPVYTPLYTVTLGAATQSK